MQGFDPVQYRQTMGHDPIYHQGTLAQGSVVQNLRQIRNQFPNKVLNDRKRHRNDPGNELGMGRVGSQSPLPL